MSHLCPECLNTDVWVEWDSEKEVTLGMCFCPRCKAVWFDGKKELDQVHSENLEGSDNVRAKNDTL